MGLHPTVLDDSLGRLHTYLRISVTDRCNLHCAYCDPQAASRGRTSRNLLSFAEILHLVRLFAGLGVTKVRLTGGEPLLRENLVHLVGELARIRGIETVALTTNGVFLKESLPELKEAGLGALNVSLDTLHPERFLRITQQDSFREVRTSLDAALEAGFVPLKVNTVIIRGFNDDEVTAFLELSRNQPINVRFIEYMPFDSNSWRFEDFVPAVEIREIIERQYSLVETPPEENGHKVAREFRIEGFTGSVGFIAPLSEKFCSRCNRLRLAADGYLKLCLHQPVEIDLAVPLRAGAADEELAGIIRSGLKQKPPAHAALESLNRSENRSMLELGG